MKILFDSDDAAQEFLHETVVPLYMAAGAVHDLQLRAKVREVADRNHAAYFAHFQDRLAPLPRKAPPVAADDAAAVRLQREETLRRMTAEIMPGGPAPAPPPAGEEPPEEAMDHMRAMKLLQQQGRVTPFTLEKDLEISQARAAMAFHSLYAAGDVDLMGNSLLPAAGPHWAGEGVRTCRVCGCTEADCRGCIAKTGQPCHWVEADLCSACVGSPGATPSPPEGGGTRTVSRAKERRRQPGRRSGSTGPT